MNYRRNRMENRKPFILTAVMLAGAATLAACSGTQPTQPDIDATARAIAAAPLPVTAERPEPAQADTQVAAMPEPLTQPAGAAPVDMAEPAPAEAPTEALPTRFVFSFATNSASLDEADYAEIKRHAEYLVAHPDAVITIAGHADIRGPKSLNEKLARARADAVALALKENGVSESQILVTSFGESVPVVSENNWRENRRVEIEYLDDYRLSAR